MGQAVIGSRSTAARNDKVGRKSPPRPSMTVASRWPATCGGAGIRRSSISSATSTRSSGASRPQPDRAAGGDDAGAGRRAGRRNGPLDPHQPGPPPAQGVSRQYPPHDWRVRRVCSVPPRSPISLPSLASTSRCRSTREVSASCRATTSKAPADWACRWSRWDCTTTKAISANISMRTASSTKNTSTPASKTCRWSQRSAPTASRSRSRLKPAPAS